MRTKNHRRRPYSSCLSSLSSLFSLSTRPRNFVPRRKNPDETRELTKGRKKVSTGSIGFWSKDIVSLRCLLLLVSCSDLFQLKASSYSFIRVSLLTRSRVSFSNRSPFTKALLKTEERADKNTTYLLFEKEHTERERDVRRSSESRQKGVLL